jgi:hypothetical protein
VKAPTSDPNLLRSVRPISRRICVRVTGRPKNSTMIGTGIGRWVIGQAMKLSCSFP